MTDFCLHFLTKRHRSTTVFHIMFKGNYQTHWSFCL